LLVVSSTLLGIEDLVIHGHGDFWGMLRFGAAQWRLIRMYFTEVLHRNREVPKFGDQRHGSESLGSWYSTTW
jgi:hypothetical protein